jgi:hypothetical protein
MKRRRTVADANRCMRAKCAGPKPIGGLGGHRDRLLKNYLLKVTQGLRSDLIRAHSGKAAQ